MFYCPKCKTEIANENVKFCPKCGFDFPKLYEKIAQRFTPHKIKNYTLLILTSLLIAMIGTLASFLYPHYYIYIIFAAISWYIVVFLTKYIGVVDVMKIEPQVKKYLRKMSILVLIINVFNIATFIKTVIALI